MRAKLAAMAGEADDSELMQRYQRGDAQAFRTLYERHKGPLYRYFLRQHGDAQLAADLFQETWTKIIAARRRYQPTAKFTTYMYTLAHNCSVDHLRKLGRTPAVAPDTRVDPDTQSSGLSAESATEVLQTRDRFAAALAALPEEQRSAFLMREEGGLSLAEIAMTTGVKEETAKSRLRYAVSKLRAVLADPGGGE